MLLAARSTQPVSAHELAEQLKVSRHHLTKIVAELARASYVKARRGNQGAVRLARAAEQIFLWDVIGELGRHTALQSAFAWTAPLATSCPTAA